MDPVRTDRPGPNAPPREPDTGACPGCGGTDLATEARFAALLGRSKEARLVSRGYLLVEIGIGVLLVIYAAASLAALPPGVHNILLIAFIGGVGLAVTFGGLSSLATGKVITHRCRACGKRWTTT